MRVDIKLEQVMSHKFIDLPLVAPDLILYSNHLTIPVLVQLRPHFLNLRDPDLMGSMCGHLRSIDRKGLAF